MFTTGEGSAFTRLCRFWNRTTAVRTAARAKVPNPLFLRTSVSPIIRNRPQVAASLSEVSEPCGRTAINSPPSVTLYIHRTIHGVGYNPMNDGGRYSIQSPILSNLPPARSTLSPPFTKDACKRFDNWFKMADHAARAARRTRTLESDAPSGGSAA